MEGKEFLNETVLVDVRSKEQFELANVKNFVNIPLGTLKKKTKEEVEAQFGGEKQGTSSLYMSYSSQSLQRSVCHVQTRCGIEGRHGFLAEKQHKEYVFAISLLWELTTDMNRDLQRCWRDSKVQKASRS